MTLSVCCGSFTVQSQVGDREVTAAENRSPGWLCKSQDGIDRVANPLAGQKAPKYVLEVCIQLYA